MTVRGIEAINLYLPPARAAIDTNVKEEQGKEAVDELHDKMTSVERYRQEWEALLHQQDTNAEEMREFAFSGDLKMSKFRSIHWALLLRVLNADHRSWKTQRLQQRQRYGELKHEFVKNPHEFKVPDDDPLSQSKQSVWNQYFNDQELFAVIRQDVVRTFPGIEFFRKEIIQNAMCNILFYYAREHPYMCYRQGMHEILAPILFVTYGDHQSLLHFREIAQTEIDDTLLDVLNPEFLEADSYSIFSRLMSLIESYYRIKNFAQSQGGYFPIHTDNSTPSGVEVIGQLNSIRDKILAKEDLHLHNYLLKLDIPLHIFGIRWLRLLFGREFALLDLLVLWDAIFADSDRFDLPNYILVAMLIGIRDKLLLSDQTTCLTYLMRYPTHVDVNLVLRHALHMQMPKKFDLPPNAFKYFTMQSRSNSQDGTNTAASQRLPPPTSTPSAKSANHVPATSSARTVSATGAQIEKQITIQQARNAADSALLARIKVGPEHSHTIMDGYAKNSPELMRLELKNAQTVITIARSKLQSYLFTVRKNVVKNRSDELAQALDGIEELCSFLDVKFMFPLHATGTPIDHALEANEQMRQAANILKERATKSTAVKHKVVSNPETVIDPTNLSLESAVAASTLYEKPDNGFMINSKRVLGSIKDIELVTIASDEQSFESLEAEQNSKAKSGIPVVDPLRQHAE